MNKEIDWNVSYISVGVLPGSNRKRTVKIRAATATAAREKLQRQQSSKPVQILSIFPAKK